MLLRRHASSFARVAGRRPTPRNERCDANIGPLERLTGGGHGNGDLPELRRRYDGSDNNASYIGTYFRVRRGVRLRVREFPALDSLLHIQCVSHTNAIPPLGTIGISTASTLQIFASSAHRDKRPSACAGKAIASLPGMIGKTLAQECGLEYLCLESRER
jgi:hypothetical protein